MLKTTTSSHCKCTLSSYRRSLTFTAAPCSLSTCFLSQTRSVTFQRIQQVLLQRTKGEPTSKRKCRGGMKGGARAEVRNGKTVKDQQMQLSPCRKLCRSLCAVLNSWCSMQRKAHLLTNQCNIGARFTHCRRRRKIRSGCDSKYRCSA